MIPTTPSAINNHPFDLTIFDSLLSENEASWYGGAIYTRGGELTINDSVFSNNDGNAIFTNLNITVDNSTFDNNRRAIYLENVSSSNIHNFWYIKNNPKLKFTVSDNQLNWYRCIYTGVVYE